MPEIDLQDRDQLVLALPKLLVSGGELYERCGDELVFAPYNLTVVKYIVLSILMQHGGQPSMTELKNMMMRSPSNMTQVIDSLEKDGLVERVRSSTDRRVNLIQITYAGHTLMGEAESFFLSRMHEFLADFSDKELRTFLKLLLRIMNGATKELGINCSFAEATE
jgi:MarR family transcriptional regulator for hemolysin